MVQRRIVTDQAGFTCSTKCNVNELYALIDSWVSEHGYTQHELTKGEHVREDGKHIEYVAEPSRRTMDYMTFIIHVTITLDNVQDTVVEQDRVKVRQQKGTVHVEASSFLELDYEHRWEKKPTFYFVRALFDQFVHKIQHDRYDQDLAADTQDLLNKLQGFFELYQHTMKPTGMKEQPHG